jgi:hypothetical protein
MGALGAGPVSSGALALLCTGLRLVWRKPSASRLLLIAVVGLAAAAAGFLMPARDSSARSPRTALGRCAPVRQFSEVREIEIEASPMRAYQAVKEITAEEIPLFRPLTSIRRLGRPGLESILNEPEKRPLPDVAARTTFRLLSDEPAREIVIATPVIRPPHRAGAAMNFLSEELRPGLCRLHTETRLHAVEAQGKAPLRRLLARDLPPALPHPPHVAARHGRAGRAGAPTRTVTALKQDPRNPSAACTCCATSCT